MAIMIPGVVDIRELDRNMVLRSLFGGASIIML
jgi:hypothetical protein